METFCMTKSSSKSPALYFEVIDVFNSASLSSETSFYSLTIIDIMHYLVFLDSRYSNILQNPMLVTLSNGSISESIIIYSKTLAT